MTSPADQLAECAAILEAAVGDRLRRDEPLGPRTTYRVGGPAALFLEAAGEADLTAAALAVAASGVPVLVVGKGSNLLVADRGFAGLAIALGETFAQVRRRRRRPSAPAGPPLSPSSPAAPWPPGSPGSSGPSGCPAPSVAPYA